MTWPSATDPLLLEAASTQRVDEFAATVRVWKADADRDLDGRRRAALQHNRRKACWHTGPDGMVHVRVDLAPDAGAIVTGALHAISERLWRDEDDRNARPIRPGKRPQRRPTHRRRVRPDGPLRQRRHGRGAEPGRRAGSRRLPLARRQGRRTTGRHRHRPCHRHARPLRDRRPHTHHTGCDAAPGVRRRGHPRSARRPDSRPRHPQAHHHHCPAKRPHRQGRRLRLPRMRQATVVVRRPPRHPLDRLRPRRTLEPDTALLSPPPRRPRRRLDTHPRPPQNPRDEPTRVHRPRRPPHGPRTTCRHGHRNRPAPASPLLASSSLIPWAVDDTAGAATTGWDSARTSVPGAAPRTGPVTGLDTVRGGWHPTTRSAPYFTDRDGS